MVLFGVGDVIHRYALNDKKEELNDKKGYCSDCDKLA